MCQQELPPDATMWLPVMPITSGELTLRPAGTAACSGTPDLSTVNASGSHCILCVLEAFRIPVMNLHYH